MKDDPFMREIKVLSRHPNGIPREIYFQMKMTGMSTRESIIELTEI